MNVEVEVIQETKTLYLVQSVRSLEEAERVALEHTGLEGTKITKQGRSIKEEPYVRWSTPVLVKKGKVLKDVQ